MYLADQLIVKATPGISKERLGEHLAPWGMWIEGSVANGLYIVRTSTCELDNIPKSLETILSAPGWVESAEADGVGFGGGTPDDPYFSSQWGFNNTTAPGIDVNALRFWELLDGAPSIVIAVLDSGLNFSHPDLQGIAWENPGEIAGDGVDNDGNSLIDDVSGWDFVNSDNDPMDDHGHGSNVTGIIAAKRNNGKGVAGMLGGVRILVGKILNANNSGLTSHLISAVTYARSLGAPVMNLSLQNYPYSSILDSEFTACQSAGIVLCICAGNQGVNNDTAPNYPSSYGQTNIIAVGNHDRTDTRYSSSNYGVKNVDLFAPGTSIISPVLGSAYSYYTGTSQATPFVTAVAAALKYLHPLWTATEIKNCILNSVVPVASYSGICGSGGRLNALNAVSCAVKQMPLLDKDEDGFNDLFEYIAGTRIDSGTSKPAIHFDEHDGLLRIGIAKSSRTDAHLFVETSPDLVNWTGTGVIDLSSETELIGGILLSSAPRMFLRIRGVAVSDAP